MGALLILLLAGLAAGADYDEVIIGINITQQLSIDVTPNTTNWTGLNIGETGTPQYFIVTNVGSLNISTLRANISNDNTNPYGTGNPLNYNAGEFILLNTSSSGFHYINKKNWYESVPGDVTTPTDWTEGPDTGYFGIIRTASTVGQNYYFFTNDTGGSDCHSGSARLLLGNDPKTVSQQGSINFSDSNEYTQIDLDTSGIGSVATGSLSGHCVVVTSDCSTATLFKWNTDLETSGGCANEADFYPSTEPEIAPGGSTSFWLEPKIPNGVPDGDVHQGTLTIIATSA